MGLKTASGDEAAAVAAALAQFEAEFTGAAAAQPPALSAWQRAALLEGVGAKETIQDLEGASRWLS
ncbi:MAG TPA: hypothetical protein VFI17_14565 [Solirubrobacterales bacterium]|nr:hypothetical protein [Solirubrobacterales bacterium]